MAGLGPAGRQSAEDWVKVVLKVLITKWLRRASGRRTGFTYAPASSDVGGASSAGESAQSRRGAVTCAAGCGYWVAWRARSRTPAVVPTYMSRVMR